VNGIWVEEKEGKCAVKEYLLIKYIYSGVGSWRAQLLSASINKRKVCFYHLD